MLVLNSLSKSKVRPKTFDQLHPYRKGSAQEGLRITTDNFDDLKMIGLAMRS